MRSSEGRSRSTHSSWAKYPIFSTFSRKNRRSYPQYSGRPSAHALAAGSPDARDPPRMLGTSRGAVICILSRRVLCRGRRKSLGRPVVLSACGDVAEVPIVGTAEGGGPRARALPPELPRIPAQSRPTGGAGALRAYPADQPLSGGTVLREVTREGTWRWGAITRTQEPRVGPHG